MNEIKILPHQNKNNVFLIHLFIILTFYIYVLKCILNTPKILKKELDLK